MKKNCSCIIDFYTVLFSFDLVVTIDSSSVVENLFENFFASSRSSKSIEKSNYIHAKRNYVAGEILQK